MAYNLFIAKKFPPVIRWNENSGFWFEREEKKSHSIIIALGKSKKKCYEIMVTYDLGSQNFWFELLDIDGHICRLY